MANEIIVNKQTLQIKQYNGQNVVTFKDIDLCHERPEGTAKRNFNRNKQHFIEGTDYFKITPNEFRTAFGEGSMDKRQSNDVIVITESGYYMIVKSFTDELSWAVQRELVNSYFKHKEEKAEPTYKYFDKTWRGEPVLTLEDAEHITGIKGNTLNSFLHKYAIAAWDYEVLAKDELQAFKRENPASSKQASKVLVITRDGVKTICRFYGLGVDEPKQFAVKKMNDQPALPDVRDDDTAKMRKQIKAARNKTSAVNMLLEKLEEMLDYKKEGETGEMLYDYYVPAYIRVLGSLQIHIGT